MVGIEKRYTSTRGVCDRRCHPVKPHDPTPVMSDCQTVRPSVLGRSDHTKKPPYRRVHQGPGKSLGMVPSFVLLASLGDLYFVVGPGPSNLEKRFRLHRFRASCHGHGPWLIWGSREKEKGDWTQWSRELEKDRREHHGDEQGFIAAGVPPCRNH